MSHPFDLTLLQHYFRISESGVAPSIFSYSADQLLDGDTMSEVLRMSREGLRTHGLDLAASFVANAFFGWAAAKQLLLAQHNVSVDLALTNYEFQAEQHPAYLYSAFRWNTVRWKTMPDSRPKEWIADELAAFYQETMNPILEAASTAAGVKPQLLWNQYGSRMRVVYDHIMETQDSDEVKNRLKSDYELLCSLDPDVFHLRKNPFLFQPQYVDNPRKPGDQLMIRSSCCLYYRRENGQKCYNCPKLTPGEREERRLAIQKETVSC